MEHDTSARLDAQAAIIEAGFSKLPISNPISASAVHSSHDTQKQVRSVLLVRPINR